MTVTGSNLADGLVLFGGMAGAANSCTATSCTATAPACSGTVDVTVLTAGGASVPTTADQYSYAGTPPAVPTPVVTKLTITGGPEAGGTQVYVNGSNLTYGTVAFGGVPGLHGSCGPDWCSAYSPPGKGVVDVTVTTAGGTSATSPADQFTYTSAAMVSLLLLTSGSGTISGATSGTEYPAGTVLTLTAAPATGYRLASWAIDGAAAGSANPLTLTMDTSHTVTASFVPTGSPAAGVTPTSLSFGAQRVGTVSSLQQVTVANTSPYPLTISKTAVVGTNPGQFKRVSSCPSSLAPGAGCTISVTFAPTSRGAKTATLAVTDNAPGSPQAVTLTGQGIAPVVGLSSSSISFPDEPVGTTSPAKTLTVKNKGDAPLTITGITVTGDFAETGTCPRGPATLAPGTSCKVAITMTPAAAGDIQGQLTLTSDAASSPNTASLDGWGG